MGTTFASFLDFPVSAHVASLGGNNVSYIGEDSHFSIFNPALLNVASANNVSLNYSIYMVGTGYGSGSYNMAFSEKDALSVGLQFSQYGKMNGYDEYGVSQGHFSAFDLGLYATYSRRLNRYFSIGATFKPVVSSYESYTSFSLGADIGVSFVDTVSNCSVGLSVRNIGGRIAGPEDILMVGKSLPINVTLGFSARLKHAPLQFHVTLQNLQKWNYDYGTNSLEENAGKVNGGLMFARKIILGFDVIPKSEKFWISLSYNLDRGLSLNNPYVLSVAGLSGGAGFKLYMVRLGIGVACYSTAATTAHISLGMDLNWFLNKNKL